MKLLHYKPTSIYLHTCDTIQDIENDNWEYYGESDVNGTGTTEYSIEEDGEIIFIYTISPDEEEEDLELSDIEGKILVRELQVYSKQSVQIEELEEDEDYKPSSVFHGLAVNFNGILIDEDTSDELQPYTPLDGEIPETFYEYYRITNGTAELLEL